MNGLTRKFLVFSLLGLGGCDWEANHGRLVGFVVDGQSGQRLNFFKPDGKNNIEDDKDSKSQVYALIKGEFIRARPCGTGDLTDTNAIEADGCFQIDDIPEGMTIPLFAQAPGYERFVGEITYPLLSEDVEHSQFVGNIRLFPKGFTVDYRFHVTLDNQPVPRVQLLCQYLPASLQGNSLQVSGDFLTPRNTGATTVSATTDEDGLAVIPGAQLVNGAEYHCEAVMSETLEGRVLAGQGNFVAGVSQGDQRLALTTDVGATDGFVYAVRSSVDDPSALAGAAGKLVITFNRPVELLPGSSDCQIATATVPDTNGNGVTGSLPTNVPDNGVSETTTTELSGDGLTLTLGYKVATAFEPGDRGTTITFGGVVLRPRSASGLAQARSLGSAAGCLAASGYNVTPLKNLRAGGNQNTVLRLF
ncbi:hypothetical protein [Archangium primigenium]|uniref:hypothetical protein n=1 Tax=[Archangium] primigenium TaxID=2792470 RepID=UPI00195BB934|nr:hypothetical protein [Archangium primigenium]MBM7118130.1 hypothetical protein [Archangium primigenium]